SEVKANQVGDLENGFNPSFVITHSPEDSYRQHSRNALMAALRKLDYDLDKIKGNEFATQNVKDNLIKFDETTAKTMDEIDDPFLQSAMQRVQDNLNDVGVIGADKENPPEIIIDEQ